MSLKCKNKKEKILRMLFDIKKSRLFLTALISIMLMSCSSESFTGGNNSNDVIPQESDMPIIFSSLKGNITRGDITGFDAATLLGGKFVVSGYKGSSTGSVGNMVFDNYLVEYKVNSAHTTQSNVADWEYVGCGLIKHAIDRGITSQKIKYWDQSQPQYDFIAWSTGKKTPIYEGTPTDGQVLVSAISPVAATAPTSGLSAAYSFQGKAADLSACYVADLVTVKKAQYGDNPVVIRFRQLGTKVRMGIYETVPGYSVKDVEFYSAATSNDASAMSARLFTTGANDICQEGKYIIYFPNVDGNTADNNKAHVQFENTGSYATTIDWGTLNYTTKEEGEFNDNVYLGRSSETASFAGADASHYYMIYLPNENGTNLNLRVNYTLESIDGSGETIVVKGATAQIPSIYTKWKPGFAYTYLFKITDKSNGHTGTYDPTKPDDPIVSSDPAGLYPITFDAVVENTEENGTQETITTISTPSITTYQKNSKVVNNDEYTTGNDIFVTVTENDALVTLTGKAALYVIPAGTTEVDVVDALQCNYANQQAGIIKGRSGLELSEVPFTLASQVESGVDGNTINLSADQALRFTPSANSVYAFVYTKKAPDPLSNVERDQYVQNNGVYYAKVIKIQ